MGGGHDRRASCAMAACAAALLAAIVPLLLSAPAAARTAAAPSPMLSALTAGEFSSDSTTPIPVSTVSVWMKRLLSRDKSLPRDLLDIVAVADTIAVAPVRQWLNAQRFERVAVQHCGSGKRAADDVVCDVNEVDPNFGTTPMHVAAATGDDRLVAWLLQRGGDPAAVDAAGRKPQNLTYEHFISNSKRWARAAGRTHCDLPEVVFEAGPNSKGHERARSEARRLVGEGEPVLLRGALRHYAPEMIDGWSVEQFIQAHRDVRVTVGSVPYAAAFDLATTSMTLGAYYDRFVRSKAEAPLYVFDRDAAVNRPGYDAVVSILRDILPIPSLIADPDASGGLDSIHFSLGRPGSGAPLHIHADAANALVSGSKRWLVYTPGRTLYSRTPIQEWIDEYYPTLAEDERPLECIQNAGDIVYVPLDWGHAVVNLEENTFGYALELLNKRDTYAQFRSSAAGDARDEL